MAIVLFYFILNVDMHEVDHSSKIIIFHDKFIQYWRMPFKMNNINVTKVFLVQFKLNVIEIQTQDAY